MGRLQGATTDIVTPTGADVIHIVVDDSEYPEVRIGVQGSNTSLVDRDATNLPEIYKDCIWELASGERISKLDIDAPVLDERPLEKQQLDDYVEKIRDLNSQIDRIERPADKAFILSLGSRLNSPYFRLSKSQKTWIDDILKRTGRSNRN